MCDSCRRWDRDSPRWKETLPRTLNFYQAIPGSSEEKRAIRQNAMEAAKTQQMVALESIRRRLLAFENTCSSAKHGKVQHLRVLSSPEAP